MAGRLNYLKRVVCFLFFHLVRMVYKIKYENKENLDLLEQHFRKGGSTVFIFNHVSLDDTIVLLTSLYFTVWNQIKKIVVPGSKKHWDEPLLGKVMRLAPLIGVDVFLVVQHYQRTLFSSREILSLDRKFLKAAKDVLSRAGGIILFAPEGHRGYGELQVFQSGVVSLTKIIVKNSLNCQFVPVGIEPQPGFSRELNIGKKFVVKFGIPFSVQDIQKESEARGIELLALIKEKIANLLPYEYSR